MSKTITVAGREYVTPGGLTLMVDAAGAWPEVRRIMANANPCNPPTTHRYERIGDNLLRCRRCRWEKRG